MPSLGLESSSLALQVNVLAAELERHLCQFRELNPNPRYLHRQGFSPLLGFGYFVLAYSNGLVRNQH